MPTRVVLDLPEDLVVFVDRLVADGDADSRTAVVTRALELERRRADAARDVAILVAAAGGDRDLDDLAAHAGATGLDLD
jgi:Arc/MetJ-type ribon-helix-helix transcriptional regulator